MRGTKSVTAAILALFFLIVPGPVLAQNNDGPPPLPPAQIQFWYAEGQQQRGPVTLDQLKALIQQGRVNKQTLVWRKGMPGWIAAGEADDIAVLFVRTDGPPLIPKDNWGEFMLGTWYFDQTIQEIYVETFGMYKADGTFSTTVNFYGSDLLNTGSKPLLGSNQIEGTWKTKALTDDKFELVLTYQKATDPTFKIPTGPLVNTLQKTGPNSLYNITGKFQVRRLR